MFLIFKFIVTFAKLFKFYNMHRKIYIVVLALGIILGISGCEKEEIENPQEDPQENDHIPPMIYLLDKYGNRT